jgi:putative glutamine amidotransferase
MVAAAAGPHPVGTMPRRRPRTSAPPLIGVVTHELREERAPAWAPMPGRSERDLAPARLALRLSYTQALQEAGAIAVVLPAHGYVDDTAALLDRVDGLLISGGPDLDPATYGQERHPLLGPDVDFVADEYEQALLRGAAERDLPLLGICRGLQALNVARGGTLHQHVPGHLQTHDAFLPAHEAEVERGSLLYWLTDRDGLAVNSFHHQAADRIGAGLEVAARAPDGTVEALWDPAARFTLGVQWHAEFLTHRADQASLLSGFVDAACGMAPQLALVA